MCRKAANELPTQRRCQYCKAKISENKMFPACDKCLRAIDTLNECPICERAFGYKTWIRSVKRTLNQTHLPITWLDEDAEIPCPKCIEFRDAPIYFNS